MDQSDVWYEHGRDSVRQPDVAVGTTTEFNWDASRVYPGTARRFWVHVPARYDPAEAAHLAIFNDGWWYLDPGAQVRAGLVLDNLVDRGEIPVTIGLFLDPGVGASGVKNRNAEYDAFDDRYATFLEVVRKLVEL